MDPEWEGYRLEYPDDYYLDHYKEYLEKCCNKNVDTPTALDGVTKVLYSLRRK